MSISPRYPIEYRISLRRLWKNQVHPGLPTSILPDKKVIYARSCNLSLTGLGLEFDERPDVELGEEYSIKVTYGDPKDRRHSLTLIATVKWIRENRCGLNIEEVTSDSRRIYHDLVEGYAALLSLNPVGHRYFG